MPRLAIITPSYAPDFELCRDLCRSVEAHAVGDVEHHLIVPRSDYARFAALAGPRTHVHRVDEYLPRSFVALPKLNLWLNLRRPFPPLRGWITQQVVKLAATAAMDADVVLLVDSDLEFVRPFGAENFLRDGVVRFYRLPDELEEARFPRHMIWHNVSRELLGVPERPTPPLTDYICWPCPWDPAAVRSMLARIEQVTGRRWADAIGAQLHFSEEILYGVYLDDVLGPPATSYSTSDMLCRSHPNEVELDDASLAEFLAQVRPTELAVMISAKSGTSLQARRRALSTLSLPNHGS